jgi:integrase
MRGSHAGIRVRHRRHCPASSGGGCRCQPNYEAWVFIPREKKKLRRSFPTLGAAKSWRVDAGAALHRGQLQITKPILLHEAAAAWLEGARAGTIRTRAGDTYKPSALTSYESALRNWVLPRLGHRKLAEIRRRDLEDLSEQMLALGRDPSTIRNALMPLRAIYRRAISREEVMSNPTVGLQLPAVRGRRDRIATPTEAAALMAALSESERALWATALYAGLRRGELQALRWEDIDLTSNIISVRRSWDDKAHLTVAPKSAAGHRSVPIAAVLRSQLAQHRLRTGGHDLAFGNGDTPFVPTTAWRRALTAWRKAGVEPISFHEARHTAASLMIAAGINAKALSSYLGHTSVALTYDRYGHLMPGNEQAATTLLDTYLTATAGPLTRASHAPVSPPNPRT